MSYLDFAWAFSSPASLTEEEVFATWLELGGGWTLDEVRDAYRSLGRTE